MERWNFGLGGMETRSSAKSMKTRREAEEKSLNVGLNTLEGRATKRKRGDLWRGMEENPQTKASIKTFSRLPDKMKAQVFSYLEEKTLCTSVVLVCKDWNRVAKEWLGLRKKLTLDGRKVTLQESEEMITSNRTYLKAVMIKNWDNANADLLLKVVADNIPFLESVSICDTVVSQNVMEFLAQECRKLQDFSLRSFQKQYLNYSKHPLEILNTCLELEKIHLTLRKFFLPLDETFRRGRNWPNLTDVSFFFAEGYTDVEVEVLARTHGAQLTKLCVDTILNEDSYILFGSLSHLETLEIMRANTLTGSGLQVGIGSLCNLRCLTLRAVPFCTAEDFLGFFSMTNVVGRLEKLTLAYCGCLNDECLSVIAKMCPLLTCFRLAGSSQVTEDGILGLVRSFRNLRYLELSIFYELDPSWEAQIRLRAASTLEICVLPFG